MTKSCLKNDFLDPRIFGGKQTGDHFKFKQEIEEVKKCLAAAIQGLFIFLF